MSFKVRIDDLKNKARSRAKSVQLRASSLPLPSPPSFGFLKKRTDVTNQESAEGAIQWKDVGKLIKECKSKDEYIDTIGLFPLVVVPLNSFLAEVDGFNKLQTLHTSIAGFLIAGEEEFKNDLEGSSILVDYSVMRRNSQEQLDYQRDALIVNGVLLNGSGTTTLLEIIIAVSNAMVSNMDAKFSTNGNITLAAIEIVKSIKRTETAGIGLEILSNLFLNSELVFICADPKGSSPTLLTFQGDQVKISSETRFKLHGLHVEDDIEPWASVSVTFNHRFTLDGELLQSDFVIKCIESSQYQSSSV